MSPIPKPETALRATRLLFYLTGLGTLFGIRPGWVYDLYTGSSIGSRFGANAVGDFIGNSNLIGQQWGYAGALVFGLAFMVTGGAEIVAGFWMSKSSEARRDAPLSSGPCSTHVSSGGGLECVAIGPKSERWRPQRSDGQSPMTRSGKVGKALGRV